jgi:hypothetical protein
LFQAEGDALLGGSSLSSGDLGSRSLNRLAKGFIRALIGGPAGYLFAAGIDAIQDGIHFGLGDIEAPKFIARWRLGLASLAPPPNLSLDQEVQAGQFGVQVFPAGLKGFDHRTVFLSRSVRTG